MFLDALGVRIYIPRMTYEQLLEFETGATEAQRRASVQRVKIDGRVSGDRADLSVEVRIQVDATNGDTIEIPLAMENFFSLGAPEFFLGDEAGNKLRVAVDEEKGGYVLLASVREDTLIGFRMPMAARVEMESTRAVNFRLPPAPVEIDLASDSTDVVGQIANRDDEVISTSTDSNGKSRFKIFSSGGRFTLQWGKSDRPNSKPLLDSDSDVTMQWKSPKDPLIQNVTMRVRDSRSPISSLTIRLPPGGTLRSDSKLITSGQLTQLESEPDPNNPDLIQITIPKQERRRQIALELWIEIPSDSPTAGSPLMFQAPYVEDAILNKGTVNITSGTDYRLRWRERPYVRNTSSSTFGESGLDQRAYTFQFDRGSFSLPIWLEATKREMRVKSDSEIELSDRYAMLTMNIQAIGNGNRSQMLSLDLGDWNATRIENARTGAELDWDRSGDLIEIELSYGAMEEASQIRILADRFITEPELESAERPFEFGIPRVVGSGGRRDPVTIQQSTFRLVGKGRRLPLVDLANSQHIERVANEETDASNNSRRFLIVPPSAQARVRGAMVDQPPRLVLENNAVVQLLGNRLITTSDWIVETNVDLEGRLEIALPASVGEWTAEVNGSPAQLVVLESEPGNDGSVGADVVASDSTERYELNSENLTNGQIEVRFTSSRAVSLSGSDGETVVEVGLPSPRVQDLTLRNQVTVQLLGDQSYDLTPVDQSLADQIDFREIPRKTIPLRVLPMAPQQSDLINGRVVIRSAVSEIAQHDQLLASLQGNGTFELKLRYPSRTDLQVSLNGERIAYKLVGDRVVVQIPADRQRHLIDVRMWADRPSEGLLPSLAPLAAMGPGNAELYWQLTVPSDNHLVWAAPSVGRQMQWQFERWHLARRPILNDTTLINRVASEDFDFAELSPMPQGNRYLFLAMDGRTFQARIGSRTLLWICVAGLIVFCTAVLVYIPSTQNPLSLMLLLVAFGGLISIAPDAAIMAGQIAMLAMVLVIVMMSLRSLIQPRPSRVLSSSRESRLDSKSQRASKPPEYRSASSVAVTHSIGPEDVSSPDGVAS